MQWGLGLIAVASLVLGVAPQIAFHYILNPVLLALGQTPVMQVTWFGLAGAGYSWWITGGLVLATASIAVGALVYMLGTAARSSQVLVGGGGAAMIGGDGGGVFTGGEILSGSGRLPASDFSAVLKKHWGGFFRWSDVDRLYLGIWEALQGVSRWFSQTLETVQDHAAAYSSGLVVLTLISWRWLVPGVTAISSQGSVSRLPLGLILSCGIACLALSLSTITIPKWRSLAPLMLLSGWTAVAGMAVTEPSLRLALLEAASLLVLPLVLRASGGEKIAWLYSALVVGAAASLVGGHLLLVNGSPEWARTLLICGVFMKFAILPVLLWLPKMAEKLPALVLGLIIAVIDIAVLGEFSILVKASPWLMTPHGVWLATAIGFALGSSLLMLTQRNLKRLLILSTIEDTGFLMLGLLSGTELGVYGALLGASVHAAAKALLYISLSAPEADGELTSDASGLACTYPISACGFLLGMLAMLGVPPTLGFAARWRLYETALHAGPLVLAAFVLSSGFSLIAYVRVLCGAWWGPSRTQGKPAGEPLLLCAVVVGLMVMLVVAGVGIAAFPTLIWGTR
jgi:formate hydrogenlyase subunit 3/multisubunit Na+/H+ antiporter MnhD subunit